MQFREINPQKIKRDFLDREPKLKKALEQAEKQYAKRQRRLNKMPKDELETFLDYKAKQSLTFTNKIETEEYRFYIALKVRLDRLKFYEDLNISQKVIFFFLMPAIISYMVFNSVTATIQGLIIPGVVIGLLSIYSVIIYVLWVRDLRNNEYYSKRVRDKIKRLTKI